MLTGEVIIDDEQDNDKMFELFPNNVMPSPGEGHEDNTHWPFNVADDDDDMVDSQIAMENDTVVFNIHSDPSLQALEAQHYNQTNLIFSDVAYFYLRDELGISEECMTTITFRAGQILGLKPAILRAKVSFLQQVMKLTASEIRDVIQKQPAILGLSIAQNLKPTIEFLCHELDMTPESHLKTLILSSPAILCYSIPNLAAKLNFFNNTMGFSRHESRGLLVAEPKLACCGLESGLLPRLKFWKGEMRIPVIQLRKIVQKNPRMLMYSLNDSLRPKLIFYLIMTLHMEPRQVLKLLLAFPHFLDYSLEEHYLPITRYFISELGYSSLEVRNVLLKCPRIMTSSLHKIKHVVGYFRYELGLEASQVKRVLYQAPQIMGLSDVNLRGKVEFIRGAFALDDMELRQVLAAVPTLLVCGVESNLQPKLDYLRGVFDNYHESRGDMIDLDDNDESIHSATNGSALLRQAFLKLPTLLIYSLERRIRPRLEQIVQAGVSPHKITVGIPMKQDKFETWLQRHEERLELRLGGVQKGKSQSVLLVESTESRNDGRIVHWTRERRKT